MNMDRELIEYITWLKVERKNYEISLISRMQYTKLPDIQIGYT